MIKLKKISKKYTTEIFKLFSYKFEKNNIYFLRGPNGSGKSTLLKLIKGIYICDDGEINFNNICQKKDIAFVDGNSRTFIHRITVLQNLNYFFALQSKDLDRSFILELLKLFSVEDLQNKKFSSLSQGQMQIISLVRALSSNPNVLLLDEVFSSLDKNHKSLVFEYLSKFVNRNEKLIIFTSHENSHKDLIYKELCLS
jgi:ABC-type multidrug transport system ATPase subunit